MYLALLRGVDTLYPDTVRQLSLSDELRPPLPMVIVSDDQCLPAESLSRV